MRVVKLLLIILLWGVGCASGSLDADVSRDRQHVRDFICMPQNMDTFTWLRTHGAQPGLFPRIDEKLREVLARAPRGHEVVVLITYLDQGQPCYKLHKFVENVSEHDALQLVPEPRVRAVIARIPLDKDALMYYRARSYDPRLGRFAQKDPPLGGRT